MTADESEENGKQSGSYEPGYVFRTLRSTAYLAVFVMLTLAAYGQSKLVAPIGVPGSGIGGGQKKAG